MEPELTTQMRGLLQHYLRLSELDLDAIAAGSGRLTLPVFQAEVLKELLLAVTSIFKNEPMLLKIEPPCIIVGDIHGHLLDLLRILKNHGAPPETKYLFLGDLVDRGEFSLETITLIILLKLIYPEHIYIIRGNHEFGVLCAQFGFQDEISTRYSDLSISRDFYRMFSYIPLTAIVADSLICIHGGIGPVILSENQLASLPRPIDDFLSDIVNSLLWSDPSTKDTGFRPSSRGTGYLFGEEVLQLFLGSIGMKTLIRGHECVNEGVESMFNGSLITVFTASNYCGTSGNKAGVLIVNKDGSHQPAIYPPLPYLLRRDAFLMKASLLRPITPFSVPPNVSSSMNQNILGSRRYSHSGAILLNNIPSGLSKTLVSIPAALPSIGLKGKCKKLITNISPEPFKHKIPSPKSGCGMLNNRL